MLKIILEQPDFVVKYTCTKLITKDNFFSSDNFEDSVVGKCVMSFVGFGMYYQFIQPTIINKIPNF